MSCLKVEPFSGISGDMFLGAMATLLDAESEICHLPARLGLTEITVQFEDVLRAGIRSRRAVVRVPGHAGEPPHHHAPSDPHPPGHDHAHDDHTHERDAHPDHRPHSHAHRGYRDIVALISRADLPTGARDLALEMFRLLGEAESAMHGIPLEQVHFHEVGAEDSILDLVGAAWLVDRLSPSAVYCTPVCTGTGFVRAAHGRLPVPAPATERLLQGMPTFPGSLPLEMTTPTGAAILRALRPVFEIPPLVSSASSLGAGGRDPAEQPNVLRVSLCHPAFGGDGRVSLLQTNLDNLSPEFLGADLLHDLIAQGALDAWITPVVMKKGRPAHQLNVLCAPKDAERLTGWILQQLPTLGVRRFDGTRRALERSVVTLESPHGPIAAKVHHLPDGSTRTLPEYESVRAAALRAGIPPASLKP